nr:hypothetical protein [Tanacetum cinerariifolium]
MGEWSEHREIAPKSSQVMVTLKFDMHIYTSTLTTKELKEAIAEYCIPTELHPLLTMDDFLKLSVWNGTVMSKGDLIPEDQCPPVHTTPPLAVGKLISENSPAQRSIEKPNAKIAKVRGMKEKLARAKVQKRSGEGSSVAPRNKRACKVYETARSNSRETISVTPIHQANPKPLNETTTSHLKDTTGNPAAELRQTNVKKEVVDLSKILAFPRLMSTQLNHQRKSSMVIPMITCSFLMVSSYPSLPYNDEDVVDHQFAPDLGLRDDLRICSFRACKELISYLATLVEDEVLSGFSNIEVVRHAYQSLGRCVLSQGKILKRHEQLNSDHMALCNRSDTQLEELSRLRNDLQSEMQANDVLSKKLFLLESVHLGCPDRERDRMRKIVLVAELAQAEMDHHKIIQEFVLTVVRLHTSVEYRKSLVVPIGLCFTAGSSDTSSAGMGGRLSVHSSNLLLDSFGKLTNLTVEECFAFNVSLRMFTRSIVIQRHVEDLQLGVESYQKKLNLTKLDSYRSYLKHKEACTAYFNLRGFIYQNKDKRNRLMRIDELHKFSDETLTDVRTALDDRLKGIRMQYKAVRYRYSNLMIQPDPEGSTQGYLLDSVEVLSFFIISSIAVQTPGSGISNLLAVGTTFTGSGNLYC